MIFDVITWFIKQYGFCFYMCTIIIFYAIEINFMESDFIISVI